MCVKIEILDTKEEKTSIRQMIKIENGNYVNINSIFATKPFEEVIRKGIEKEVSAIK